MKIFKIKGLLFILGLALVFCWQGVADSSAFQGKVIGEGINLRADSTANSEIIAKLKQGEPVEVVQERYDWYKIRLPKSVPVYIKKELAELIPEPVKESPAALTSSPELTSTTGSTAKVLKDNVNIRLHPGEAAMIVGKVKENEVIRIQGQEEGWYKIIPPNDSFGWVHKNFIRKETLPAKNEVYPQAATNHSLSAGQPETAEIKGVIRPYGIVLRRVATHKLITAQNQVFLLKGEKKTLDNLNNRRVKVIGKIIPQPNSKIPLVEIEKIEVEN